MNLTVDRLFNLKNIGFEPSIIFDIGANVGNWTLGTKLVFPDSSFFLVEANEECRESLDLLCRHNKNLHYDITLLSDKEDHINFFLNKNKCSTGNSIFIEDSINFYGDNFETKRMFSDTLDNIANKYNFNHVDLLKIDTQGSELLVLDGAKKIIEKCQFILLEISLQQWNIGSPLFIDVIKYMDNIGYYCFDIIQLGYADKQLIITDIIFNKKNNLFKFN